MYHILPTAKISETAEEIILRLGTKQSVAPASDRDLFATLLAAAQDRALDKQSIVRFTNDNRYHSAMDKLVHSGVLGHKSTRIEEGKDRFEYKSMLYLGCHTAYPDALAEKISSTSVIILGCGGIGQNLAYSLISFGINHIILVDGDTIEESNLNRQYMFQRKDTGRSKVDVLKERLKLLRDDLVVDTYGVYADRGNLDDILGSVSTDAIAAISGDSEDIMLDACKACVSFEIPFLNVGYLNDISVIGPFWRQNGGACPF